MDKEHEYLFSNRALLFSTLIPTPTHMHEVSEMTQTCQLSADNLDYYNLCYFTHTTACSTRALKDQVIYSHSDDVYACLLILSSKPPCTNCYTSLANPTSSALCFICDRTRCVFFKRNMQTGRRG